MDSIRFDAPIDGQRRENDSAFPYVILCEDPSASLSQTTDWVRKHRDALLDRMKKHGAVALRGFPTATVEAFDAVVQALQLENFPYQASLSNAVRTNRTPRVFSANEAPADVRIFFHHEMAQTPIYPKFIFFYCEVPAESGGATPLVRSDVLFERLQKECPAFTDACRRLGLRYTNVMPADDDANSGMGRSWRSTLGVENQSEAESRLQQLGYSYRWNDDGSLSATTPALPAAMDLEDGRTTFFNQLIAAYCGWSDDRNDPSKAIRHGDGSPLDADSVAVAVRLSEALCYDHRWQQGDVVLVDNRVAMHARRPFSGKRKILASLAEMRSHQHVAHGDRDAKFDEV